MNDAMYEHAATQANLATLRERGALVLEPGTGALGSPGEWGIGRLPEPPDLLAAIEAAIGGPPGASRAPAAVATVSAVTPTATAAGRVSGARHRRRHARADRRRAVRRQPLVRPDGLRAGRRGGPARRRRDRRGRERRRSSASRGSATSTSRARATWPRPASACSRIATSSSWPRRSPTTARRTRARTRSRRRTPGRNFRCGSCVRRTCSRRSPPAAGPASSSSASRPRRATAALEHGRDKLARKQLDAVVVNDVGAPGIGFDSPENEVTVLTAGGERHVPRASKAEVARAVLDAVLSHRSSTTLRV